MSYAEQLPHEALRPFVECFWTIDSLDSTGTSIVYPDGCCDLIWNVGEGLSCALVGAMSRAIAVPNSSHRRMIGVRFHPGALYPLLRIPMQEHKDRILALQDISSLHPLSRMGAGPSLLDIESTLLRIASSAPYRSNDILYAIARIQTGGARESVLSLAQHLRMSTRTLERKFHEQTGLGPKEMMRVLRFRKARRMLARRQSMADVVDQCGYYDQSHFHKDLHSLGVVSGGFLQDAL